LNFTTDANKKFQKELNSGTAALVLLSILAHADAVCWKAMSILPSRGRPDVTIRSQNPASTY
jgi:hypothetical protein